MNWYEESFFNIHVDYHTQAGAETGAGLTREYLREFLGRVRPDMIQVHSKGHPGIASYPTEVGAVSENHRQDVLALYREVTREMGIRFSVYYSSLVDTVAANAHPEWRIVKADGSYYGTGEKWQGDSQHSFFLCHNSGYVSDYLLPQVREILTRYRPDGLWFDGDVWVPQVCYCANCQAGFRARHGRDVPQSNTDPAWPLATAFVRETYLEYLQRVRDLIQAVYPACLFSVNWLHTLRDPWAPQPSRHLVDWLSGDVPLNHGLKAAGREARFMNHQGLPFDIMICDFSLDYRTRGYMYHKSAVQMEQEAAAVLANGARLFYWITPSKNGAIRVEDPPTVQEVADFARARQPFCSGTVSAPDIAILVSAAGWQQDYKLMLEGDDLRRVFAAQQILTEAGLHHDLVSEDAFLRAPGRWPMVILPGIEDLSPALTAALSDVVRAGGKLLLSGPLPADSVGALPADLAALTGLSAWELAKDAQEESIGAARVLLPGGWARVYYNARRGQAGATQPRGQLWDVNTFAPLPGLPVSYLHTLGAGQVLTLAGDLFDGYRQVQAPALRDLILQELRFLHPHPVAQLEPAGQIEIAVRQRADAWLIHLVNHGADRDMGGDSYFVERVPGGGPRTLLLRCPSPPHSITLQPGYRPLAWQRAGDTIRVVLEDVGVHDIIQLRFIS